MLPRRLQIEFSSSVQAVMDVQGTELSAADLSAIFADAYRLGDGEVRITDQHVDDQADGRVRLSLQLACEGVDLRLHGEGSGPLEAFVDGLQLASGCAIAVLDYHEHAIGSGAQARAAAYVELRIADTRTLFGVGMDANIATASMKAVVSGLLRAGVPLQKPVSNPALA